MSSSGADAVGLDLVASIETLWHDPEARSRNRNFDQFKDPHSAHARRVVLYLLMLRAEIEALEPGSVLATRGSFSRGPIRLAYRNDSLGLQRVIYLKEHEAGLLLGVAKVRDRVTWEPGE